MFSTCLDNLLPFSSNLKLSSANKKSLKFVVWYWVNELIFFPVPREMIEKHRVCVRVLGNVSLLPESLQKLVAEVVDISRNNTRYDLIEFTMVNSLPNDNFSDLSKLKAFADEKINVT